MGHDSQMGMNVGEEWAQRVFWEIRVMKALLMSSHQREGSVQTWRGRADDKAVVSVCISLQELP